jgi:hypothetical protein
MTIMQLTKNFSLEELLVSEHTKTYPEQLKPSQEIRGNLLILASRVLQPLRDLYGKPLVITSAYRCPAVNAVVGGSRSSAHLKGLAADIQCDNNYELFKLACNNINFLGLDQVIHEYGIDGNPAWVHIGISYDARHEILIKRKNRPYQKLTIEQALSLDK